MRIDGRKKGGFTLVEIMTTVAIMGILMAIAVPNFMGSMQRARQNEARVNLNVIHMAQKVYRLNRNTYWNGGNGVSVATINANLGTELSAQNFTTYNITGTATTYTATTTGQGKTFTMTQTGTLTES